MLRILKQTLFIIPLIFLVAGLPTLVRITEEQFVIFSPSSFVVDVSMFISDLLDGSLGTYYLNHQEREITDDLWPFAWQSFIVLISSMLFAIVTSLIAGIFLQRWKIANAIKRLLDMISIVPDFVIILMVTLLSVFMYKSTGLQLITLSPLKTDLSKYWFPIFTLSVGPTLYLIRLVDIKYRQIGAEDYVRTAVAKGMGSFHVQLHHLYKNIKPYFMADIKKALSIAVANLFIVEYLLNISGVTRLIFGHYQFGLTVIGFATLILMIGIVYSIIAGILYLFERGFIYE
ncbi:ABC transporter permease subunit [Brevibacillus daliensis]|uniref:ABC transporter permease subunit n=1 Tax=Brevibacillus daliensis TaxID=2892995 RepID=UPI001E4B27E5|nr:ABC transporter permease subunit [Brevibacillus daliensis]